MSAGETHRNNATVTAEGEESGIKVDDEDEWNAHTPASYAIGDYVWVDTNKDGLQDDGEDPLEGVKVELTDADDEPVTDVFGDEVEPTFTDAEGRYLFDNLPAGEYKVKFTLTDDQAEKYIFTELNAGDDTAVDSDADPATGWTETIVLNDDTEALTSDYDDQQFDASEGIDPTWDAGVTLKTVSVGDYVWHDKNRDGLQDEEEPGIPGVTLCLIGPDGEPVTDVFGDPVGPVVTDDDGFYTFDNLPALSGDDTYTVCIDRDESKDALAPYIPTLENEGDDRAVDSSTWEATTLPGDLHEDGDRDPTLDFGFITKSYAIGDYVWVDTNKDGLQDDGEDPLEGVKVELTDADGEPVTDVFGDEVEPTFTDSQGRYLFDDLPAGEYKVRFTLTDEQSEKYIFTELNAGDDTAVDSDADPATGWTQVIVLNDDNTALTTDYDREVLATQGIDPTWDAGVVLKPTPTTPGDDGEEDADDDDSGSRLPDSGMDLNLGIVVLAAALLAAGAGAVHVARRKN